MPAVVIRDASEVKYESFNRQSVNKYGMVVSWSSLVTVTLSCAFDVSRFPFDHQYCPITFGPMIGFKDIYNIGLHIELFLDVFKHYFP